MRLDCATAALLLQADHDGELDAGRAAELAAHLAACPACRARRDALRRLSLRLRAEAPRHAASPLLRARIERRTARAPRKMVVGGAAGLALAACLSLVLLRPGAAPGLDGDLLAAHIRALQPGHLTDVISTDRHTVKPWFSGKLDFSPPVADFSAQGYPLVGGRLDYVDGRTAAVLVYRRHGHIIDVFIWPGRTAPASAAAHGYTLRRWEEDGLVVTALSDLNPAELDGFAALFRAG